MSPIHSTPLLRTLLGPGSQAAVLSRRRFLGVGAAAAAPALLPLAAMDPLTQDSLAGRGRVGTLRNPAVVGRERAPTEGRENDPEVQWIEQRLACNCGCTLDVFTCRTTDFSCTYSPALHREVLALRESGKTAQQVLDAFVAKYGEKALMAPKPQGFNLAGYLVPGVAVLGAGALLLAVLGRRRARLARAPVPETPQAVQASPEEMERLRRALDEVDQ